MMRESGVGSASGTASRAMTALLAAIVVSLALLACAGEEATSGDEPAAGKPATAMDATPEAQATATDPPPADDPTATAEGQPEAPEPAPTQVPEVELAPELVDIDAWYNSEPLTLEELRGRPVLLVFWASTLPTCRSEVPTLNQWFETYGEQGLTIIGVHGPDFPGAQPAESAARELGIRYPVAENESKATWQAYGIGARPAWALIGADGSLLHRQIGKVTTDEVRERIEAALAGG